MTTRKAIKQLELLYKQCEKFEKEISANSIWNLNQGVNAPLTIDKTDSPWREFEATAKHYFRVIPTSQSKDEFLKLLERYEIDQHTLADLKVLLKQIMLDLELPSDDEDIDDVETGTNSNYTLNITAPVSNVQIQQGTINSAQMLTSSKDFNYNALAEFLDKIRKYPQIDEEFGDNAVEFQQIVVEAQQAVEDKKSPSKIKKLLETLRDLTVGISGSLIASGIAAQIPILMQQLGL